jgi:hypothetical protein
VTGIYFEQIELAAKRIDLLKHHDSFTPCDLAVEFRPLVQTRRRLDTSKMKRYSMATLRPPANPTSPRPRCNPDMRSVH